MNNSSSRSFTLLQRTEASNNKNDDVPHSCHTVYSNGYKKKLHSSHLGRPPGNEMVHPMKSPQPRQATIETKKIVPMKQIEKMITDLKKENFDLKLRLYHLEEMMTKDVELYELKQENYKLRMNLEHKSKGKCSIGIQTKDNTFESTPEAFGLSLFKKSNDIIDQDITSIVEALQEFKLDNVDNWLNDHQQRNLRHPLF